MCSPGVTTTQLRPQVSAELPSTVIWEGSAGDERQLFARPTLTITMAVLLNTTDPGFRFSKTASWA